MLSRAAAGKRACRSDASSSATPERRDWSLLDDRVIVHIGDRFLADNDLDYYNDFRAVCGRWRRATPDPKDGADPRFQPKAWAVRKHFGSPRLNSVVSMVNLKTCRFVTMEIPMLSNYRYINATDGGLLVLWEGGLPPWLTYRALVLNPFTGFKAYFVVPIFAAGIRAVAVDTSPLMLFASNLFNYVGWADLNSRHFELHRIQHPDFVADMRLFAGDIYVVNRHGSIISTANAIADGGRTQRSARTITINPTTTIRAAASVDYHLVESAGELLLVTRPTIAGQPVLVHKLDTINRVLEPVVSIGSRALFISEVRSFSIDASMFPTVEGGCIYFVEPLATVVKHGIIASSLRLVDQRKEDIVQFGFQGRNYNFGPPTVVQVLADHCRYTSEHEMELYHGRDWAADDSEDYKELDGAVESEGSN
uniref:KIB1-4 beta-propeller domain-containing protein n=1 Tax=Setaria italica TaxID=4555 RepID=K3XSV7_SETIT